MAGVTYTIPIPGVDLNSAADAEVVAALQAIETWSATAVDPANWSAAAAKSAGVNQSGQTVKGAVSIAAAETTASGTFTLLTTPDQVAGIVLSSPGLIRVWYQATWQESVSFGARAAIFLGANETQQANATAPTTGTSVAILGGTAATTAPLSSYSGGLRGIPATSGYAGNATTGQVIGMNTGASGQGVGGPCDIFAAAGTYMVSVQFTAASGSVTVSNRQLWVQALSFA